MKTCRICKKTRPTNEFHIALTTPEKVYRRRKCKDCYNVVKAAYKTSKRNAFRDFKKTLECVRCGTKDWRLLQFHHENGDKEANIADVVDSWSQTRLETEIAKCCVLCANCHIIHHYEERNRV